MVWERSQDECHRLVDTFAEMMKNELDENFFKGDREAWQTWSLDSGIEEIEYHLEKLKFVIEQKDPDRIKEHSADIGNCCMILLDLYGYIEPQEPVKPTPQPLKNYSSDYLGS